MKLEELITLEKLYTEADKKWHVKDIAEYLGILHSPAVVITRKLREQGYLNKLRVIEDERKVEILMDSDNKKKYRDLRYEIEHKNRDFKIEEVIEAYFLIKKVERYLKIEKNITVYELSTLYIISNEKNGRCSQKVLKEQLDIYLGNKLLLVKGLEEKGYITKVRSLEDQRKIYIKISDANREKYDLIQRDIENILSDEFL